MPVDSLMKAAQDAKDFRDSPVINCGGSSSQ